MIIVNEVANLNAKVKTVLGEEAYTLKIIPHNLNIKVQIGFLKNIGN